jgi:hypothetical protein
MTYLVGMVGLNELVRISTGKHLHESSTALKLGLKIVAHMKKQIDKLSRKTGMRLILEQSPAETTAYRFARLDLRYFSPGAGRFIRGDVVRGGLYYTNSTNLDISVKMKPFERVRQEGLFHSLIEGAALTNLRLEEERPSKGRCRSSSGRSILKRKAPESRFPPISRPASTVGKPYGVCMSPAPYSEKKQSTDWPGSRGITVRYPVGTKVSWPI